MASWELQCMSAIIKGAEGRPSEMFDRAREQGLRFEVFGTMDGRNLWAKVESHYTRQHNFGHVPSEQDIRETMPTLALATPVENFQDLCQKVLDGWAKRESDKHVQEYLLACTEDVNKALVVLRDRLGQLQERSRSSGDVHYRSVALQQVTKDLENVEQGNGMTGIPFPWDRMNEATGGIQPGDFIMVWALPKSMKTWFGLIITAHLFDIGQRVLIYSKEMRWDAIRTRIICMIAKVDYAAYRRGQVTPEMRQAILQVVERTTSPDFSGELFFTDADRADGGPGGPDDIRRKIELYKPQFVMLDSSYMLELPDAKSNALDWKPMALVSRQLKQIAKTTKIPMLAILQENERAALKYTKSRGTASIAMNTGAVMDCDLGLRLVRNRKLNELSIHFAACRETAAEGFTIAAVPCTNFDYVGDHLHGVGDDSDEDEEAPLPPRKEAAKTASFLDDWRSRQREALAGAVQPVVARPATSRRDEIADDFDDALGDE
jgi:replicative DNA helicase